MNTVNHNRGYGQTRVELWYINKFSKWNECSGHKFTGRKMYFYSILLINVESRCRRGARVNHAWCGAEKKKTRKILCIYIPKSGHTRSAYKFLSISLYCPAARSLNFLSIYRPLCAFPLLHFGSNVMRARLSSSSLRVLL